MAEVAMRMTATGKVQGVGYRDYLQTEGAKRHVRGWVRNAADGSVEAVLAGEALDLEDMAKVMRDGPDGADVADVSSEPADADDVRGCKDIEVRD
ncbi:acylphosphatase [Roseivivax marinus]|uniref:acylphosphatase n=1 Tax=Roseivivax marinus TaxID=1379903 RepID=W4HM58_9RHOB|nr:acylphosphatase [Roseivivax marinus]ETW13819.1 acylphosphatase [Roseivivax marinus]SEL64888.1 acylphosphatase [Roseivivax marinus]